MVEKSRELFQPPCLTGEVWDIIPSCNIEDRDIPRSYREDLARRKPRALDKCEATNSQKGIWRSREVPIYILQDGLLPETIQGSKGAFKNKRGKNMVKLG